MHERVAGFTDAVLEDLGDKVGPVAGELESFVRLLEQSDDLRFGLANSNTPMAARRAIIQELLGRKLSRPTLDLLSFAVQSGPAADYVHDVAGIAAAAVARRDGLVLRDEGPLGRTAATQRLGGYATAVLSQVRGERHLGEVEDELFRFMRTVRGSDELNAVLTTAEVPAHVRQAVVRDLLARRATPASVRLAAYVAGICRPRDYPALLEALIERVASEADRQVADVRSAVEMTKAQRLRLAAALTRFAGYEVDVRVSTEPGLLGGFVASVGDMVFDASLRRRLQQARSLLFAPSTSAGDAAPPGPGQS
ncbi:MAG: F0F1 ATP synthase subunit delta [Acidimicrobiales bacterium]|jgi:F-type H+-transporting ATPase subunit delta